MSTGLMTTTASPARPPSRDDRSSTAVGMFPGLGSRAAYRNLDRSLLDSGIPAVTEVYRAGAQAMGFGDRHDRLIMVPKTCRRVGWPSRASSAARSSSTTWPYTPT